MARYVACLLLLALGYSSIAGAAGLVGRVVCIGADGHVAVELSQNSKCNQFVGKELSAVPIPGFELQAMVHCGSCLDVGLQVAQTIKTNDFYDRVWLTSLPAPGAAIAIPTILVAEDPLHSPPYPLVHTTSPYSTLRERRTVVIQV